MQKSLKQLLFIVFFYQSYAYANFPFLDIVYADSCENPQIIVKWVKDSGNNGFVQKRLMVDKKSLDTLTPQYVTYNRNNNITIEYEDYQSSNYTLKGAKISYQFKDLGYNVTYRYDYHNGQVVADSIFVKTGARVPETYKCENNSNASIKFNNEIVERNARSASFYEAETERRNLVYKKLRSNCRGQPNINAETLEKLSNQLRVSPKSIVLNRLSMNEGVYFSCNAIFYHPKGTCTTDVDFDNRGNINKMNDQCK